LVINATSPGQQLSAFPTGKMEKNKHFMKCSFPFRNSSLTNSFKKTFATIKT
jgi:hypothetical protein